MDLSIMEKVVVQGDLSGLKPEERLIYYTKVCESVGLNPLTKPFDYLRLDGKLVLYAKRDATDQLRKIHKISITIVNRERIGDVYCVTARGTTPDGRTDESIGAVSLSKEEKILDEMRQRKVPTGKMLPLTADEMANAIMKAETKAKRRVTLSLAGLGMMDESEIESVQDAERIEINNEGILPPAAFDKPKGKTTKSEKKGTASAPEEKKSAPPADKTGELYKMLDFATGTSPGGVTFAKMKVENLATGDQEVVIARTPEALEQVTAIDNGARFELNVEIDNGFKIVKSVRIASDAA
ncbi:hypothetical protein J1TS5_03490 [Paenibacillus macerans]|uniref:hypothetical protein n=1 Tax=Paenibacillus macerans TaxID=44252 RepID=UPI001B1955AB|nr:hypothetical protein [Paenibacillus macerans]GIP08179.1 hypothetical protein J1TS5_03490 [Paenibacillus macerans]